MSKTLIGWKLKKKFQTPTCFHYLLQVVQQLEKKGEKEFFFKKLVEKKKSFFLSWLFKLDLQFFNRRELEKKLKEAEEERTLAAQLGQALLQKKESLEEELKILKEKLTILERQLEGRISQEKIEELKKTLKNYEELEQE